MTPPAAAARRERAAALRQQIDQANHAYYVLDAPTISDAEYDQLFRELQSLEAEHPELRSPDSPTLRVGATPATFLVKHTHARPMLSLANAFSPEELVAWEERNARLASDVRTAGYALEIKIDGAAVSLTYENGQFLRGTTRGNGLVGEDITPNLRTIHDIPLKLKGSGHPAQMEVRGEVYLPFRNFERVNREREEAGEPLFANVRNAASGGLRALDPEVTRRRRLAHVRVHRGGAGGRSRSRPRSTASWTGSRSGGSRWSRTAAVRRPWKRCSDRSTSWPRRCRPCPSRRTAWW